MKNLLHNIRFYVLAISVLISIFIYSLVITSIPQGNSQIAKIVQLYGLTALIFLYISLLAGPFCYTFRSFPYKEQLLKARRALGVSVFYFAFLHSWFSFFDQLGGFDGLGFLQTPFLLAITFGFIALVILFLLTITSFDYAVSRMTFPKWKMLHRFVYFAGVCTIIHFLLIGTHFSNLSGVIPQVTFLALSFLFLLEAPRFDKYFSKIIPIHTFGISFVLIAVLLSMIFVIVIIPTPSSTSTITFDIHSAHKQLAKEAQQKNNSVPTNIPGLNGDKAKRYNVSISSDSPEPQPNQNITIHFTVYDAASGNQVIFFRTLYEKPMHLVIVNSDLTFFQHIHPQLDGQSFTVTTQFPKNDLYHLYITFQPFGGIEQQMAFTLPIGHIPNPLSFSKDGVEKNQTKTFGNYEVSLNTHGQLQASAMSLGQQTISFTIKDGKTKKPITNLKPYLAAFGHVTMINEKTFDFLHIHPYVLTPPKPDEHGGPTVDFLPIGIYGPFKPGLYRLFAEFNPDGHLFTADFTVKIN